MNKPAIPQSNPKSNNGSELGEGITDLRALHSKLMKAEGLRRAGNLSQAENLCRELLETHPTYVGALQTFGLVCLEEENFPQAVTCFTTAAAEAPKDHTNYINLAMAWLGLDVSRMAEMMLLKAKEISPDEEGIYQMLGDISVTDRRYEVAIAMYRKCLELDPNSELAMFRLGECLVDHGLFADAQEVLTRLHQLQPKWLSVLHLLLKLPKEMVNIDYLNVLKNSERRPGETEAEFTNNRKFLKGAILAMLGQEKEAWSEITSANQEIVEDHKKPLQRSRARQESELLVVKKAPAVAIIKQTSASVEGSIPLFILGPSRSGKTTLEVLIDAHGEIKRGYENSMVEDATIRVSQQAGLIKLHRLQLLPKPLYEPFSKEFRSLMSDYSGGRKCVTHTNPGLIGSVVHIAQALPEAKFIFVSRNREDTALRIFMQKYKRGNSHAYNLRDTLTYIDWYTEMVNELSSRLGERSLQVQYEDMVTDPGHAARAALEFCGLDGSALDFPEIGSDVGVSIGYADYMKRELM